MAKTIAKIVIVGGGSAGWISAGLLAAELKRRNNTSVSVTLIESPDINIIGVGEGTWPSMRGTLHKIGVSESEFISECNASFKHGAKFISWTTGAADDSYYHPFVLPQGYPDIDVQAAWQSAPNNKLSFADAVCVQSRLHEKGRAPKQITTPEFLDVANYAYHLDATKLGEFLKKHCIAKLGVQHIQDHVTGINAAADGDIASLSTKMNGNLEGDLFIDCTGMASLLLGKHYQIPFLDKRDILFIDSALAIQLPYTDMNCPVVPSTLSTAQKNGWIWDIALSNRRGVGHVYSSAHGDDEQAEKTLRAYVSKSLGEEVGNSIQPRKLTFNPGHREKFWHRNCVAIGMSSGFMEPLEASALAMVELSAGMIAQELPATRDQMDPLAERFNSLFLHRWQKIIEFLKLHYVLSQRDDSDFWRDNRKAETIPARLTELLQQWRHRPPSINDLLDGDAVFPCASYQYVLYGMLFQTKQEQPSAIFSNPRNAQKYYEDNRKLGDQFIAGLPSNRELIEQVKTQGFPALKR